MNAAEIARSMETDAVDFYTKAAGNCTHTVGKQMFLSIPEDERRHIQMIEALIKGLGITEDNVDPMERVKSVFAELKDEMQI